MLLYFSGQWHDRLTKIEVRHPYDNSVVDTVPVACAADVDAAIAGAVQGAAIVRKLPGFERFGILRKAADAMLARKDELGRLISQSPKPATRHFFISSPLVWKLHGKALARAMPKTETILLPDGERHKNLQTVGRIYDALIRARADRSSTLVAIGGGVLGDTAGFAAATFLRGVPLVHVPTTLLAQVDSAIGGKVGVNHALGKNLIGAFHPPALVVVDPAVLSTLPRREFRAGLYEVIKYGVIASPSLFERVASALPALFALAGFVYVLISRKNFLKEVRYAAVLVVVGLTIYFIRARMRGEWPFEKRQQVKA